jgi:hypothetical protein
MDRVEFCEKERIRMERFSKFLLPKRMKIPAILLTVIAFIALLIIKVTGSAPDFEVLRIVLKKLMLLSMLAISLSKEKEEDEMTMNIRMRSYVMAFIVGVAYFIVHPLVNYLFDLLFTGSVTPYEMLNGFTSLWFILAIQIMLFHSWKRLM